MTTPNPAVTDVLGALTPEAIKRVTEKKAKAQLEATYALAKGAATILLDTTGNSAHLAKALGEIHLTLDDVRGLVSDAVALIAELEDRDAKEAAFHVAVAALETSENELHGHLSSYALLLRGKLGSKSAELTQFGVAPLAPGGRRNTLPPKPAPSK